ncbi:hypothetical protein ACFYUD_34725 [Nocardia tengchongensis]|uniref:hypothetical protein n=1 Tax=Nocardia tengchongensis TaxID=2055889 RepID=UPI0036864B65
MIECVFECWDSEFAAAQRRVVDPPTPVLVDLSVAVPTSGPFRRDSVSLRIKAGALDLSRTVPGLLYAWAQCTDGSWLGLVGFAIPTGCRPARSHRNSAVDLPEGFVPQPEFDSRLSAVPAVRPRSPLPQGVGAVQIVAPDAKC